MSDNTVINIGSGGDIVRDLDRGGVKTQVMQLDIGGSASESLVSPTNGVPIKPQGFVPVAGSASAIASAGVAITAVAGPISGGFIINPSTSTQQGIATAEAAYLDMVATPTTSDNAANGTTLKLFPGDRFDIPPIKTGVSVKVNAVTAGHKFTVVVWQ